MEIFQKNFSHEYPLGDGNPPPSGIFCEKTRTGCKYASTLTPQNIFEGHKLICHTLSSCK